MSTRFEQTVTKDVYQADQHLIIQCLEALETAQAAAARQREADLQQAANTRKWMVATLAPAGTQRGDLTTPRPGPADRCSAPRAVIRSVRAGPRGRARWRCGGPSPPWPAGRPRPPARPRRRRPVRGR